MNHIYKAIMFDFDGVICESNEVKTEAFRKLFSAYPEYMDRIIDYHKRNLGISRFRKFEFIYKEILKKEWDENESKKLGEKFSEYVYKGVLVSPFVQGGYEFLEKYHKQLLLFIVSGTPQTEIISIVKEKQLDRFFHGVYGSPATKSQIIRQILGEKELAPDDVIFVGDSINDYEGAEEAGIRMIGRIQENYPNPFTMLDKKSTIRNIYDLEVLLKNGIV